MHSRASVHGSTYTSSTMPAIGKVWTSSRAASLRAVPQFAANPREIDAELYLFSLCKQFQTVYLHPRGIGCVLDADGTGRLPETVCRTLGLMVRELLNDAAECAYPKPSQDTVTVTLRRRGTTYLCAVSNPCGESCACKRHGLRRAQQLASQLSDRCVIRAMPDRGITAIMFDIDLSEQCFAEPISFCRTQRTPPPARKRSRE
jgi:two-component sensor histidine kinase